MNNNVNELNDTHNKDWQLAWHIVSETDCSLFLTGKAGTGKTTFLHYVKTHINKRHVVLAPTGIAAINAKGMTIHSFFQLPFSPFIPNAPHQASLYKFSKEKLNIIRGCDLVIIDEISMVRSDLLDAVDDALRRHRHNNLPFGGVQLLMIGDMQQLPPVVKDEEWKLLQQYYDSMYFFDSIALKRLTYATVELKSVFRQTNEEFITILNKIRNNDIDDNTLLELNKRYIPNFIPTEDSGYIQLTTHNQQATQINEEWMQKLPSKGFTFEAEITGNFPEVSYPTEQRLVLKEGAQVMFVKNDTSPDKLYYNGMLGRITSISGNSVQVTAGEDNRVINVSREEWKNIKYSIDKETNEIRENIEGTFSQLPLRLAWAITIHKSQGLTFSKAIINTNSAFAHGQTYVALSRCRSLDSLVLSAPISRRSIIRDTAIDDFSDEIRKRIPNASQLTTMKQTYLLHTIENVFDFNGLRSALNNFIRIIDEHLYKQYPKTLENFKLASSTLEKEVCNVSLKFHNQYKVMVGSSSNGITEELQQRIFSGATYFIEKIEKIDSIFRTSDIVTKNKQIEKQLSLAKETLADMLLTKIGLLRYAKTCPFSTEGYLNTKAKLTLTANSRQIKKKSTIANKDTNINVSDITDQKLFDALVKWRLAKAKEESLPAYCILYQKAIIGISNTHPRTIDELILIPHIGKAKADKYGKELLDIVEREGK